MKRLIKPLVIAILLAAVAGIGVRAFYANRSAGQPDITTAAVTRGSITDVVVATGTLQAVTTVQVGTQVSGNISWLGADFNSIVRKGQVIAKLDPSLFQTQVEQARANLTKASADLDNSAVRVTDAQQKYTRAKELADRQLLATSDLDAAKVALDLAEAQMRSTRAQVAQAQAAVNQAELNLSHTVISAPIDGIVIGRSVDVGQTVAASLSSPTVFSIAADLSDMQLSASIDESDIGKIRPGQRVTFQVDAYPGRQFAGAVSQVRLQPTVVQNVTTYNVMIDVPNPNLELKPGMTANVNIEIASRDDVVRVPNAALRFRPTAATFQALGLAPSGSEPVGSTDATRSPATPGGAADKREGQPRGAANASEAVRAKAQGQVGAKTVDALFGPLDIAETDGRVWVHENGQLKPVAVRLGVSDGQNTELLAGDLPAGAAVVTNVITGAEASTRPNAAGSGLFMPGGRLPGGRQGG
jgi:HlyD family secretion protein